MSSTRLTCMRSSAGPLMTLMLSGVFCICASRRCAVTLTWSNWTASLPLLDWANAWVLPMAATIATANVLRYRTSFMTRLIA
ncbi:hypothetical protein D9M71_733550 [compost metagenome]